MTTTTNIGEMKSAIPLAKMPPLFQDAVIITRKLGLRHLWIDSLCIIQDSNKDWEFEVMQMENVYRYSVLNIAAASSKNCDDRILGQRHLAFPSIKIPFASSIHNFSGDMYVRPHLDSWQDVLQFKSTLSSRAWVLQETMMAPRTLHYCEQQMLWECRSLRVAEGCLTPLQSGSSLNTEHQDDWSLNKRFLLPVIIKDNTSSVCKARDTLYMQWYTVIERYTLRDLTILEDRLPALASLASSFECLLADKYQAGLFANDLERGLLWQTRHPLTAAYSKAYRAPSWSWASVDSPVKYHFLAMRGAPRQTYVEVLHIETYSQNHEYAMNQEQKTEHSQEANSTPSLQKTSGPNLPEREKALETHLIKNHGHSIRGLLILRGAWRGVHEWIMVQQDETSSSLQSEHNDGESVSCHFDVPSAERSSKWLQIREKLGLLHISSVRIPTRKEGQVMALLLETTEHDPNEYRRVGIAFLSSKIVDHATDGWCQRTVRII